MNVRVAVLAPLYVPARRGGGPIRTLEALVEGASSDYETFVFTGNRDLGLNQDLVENPDKWVRKGRTMVYYGSIHKYAGLAKLILELKRLKPDYIYLNSYWHAKFSQAVLHLSNIGVFGAARIVLAPRGEFAEGALARRSLKKKVVLSINKVLRVHRKLLWHASTAHELQDIERVLGKPADVVVREDDTNLPTCSMAIPDRRVGSSGRLRLIFVGRLVEHKGAHLAVHALAASGIDAQLDVYGPKEDGFYFEKCFSPSVTVGLSVAYRGSLDPEEVVSAVNEYDLMLLPTRSENFGHVIAESLAAAVPIMTTPHTPWTDLIRDFNAGVIVERNLDSWVRALQEYEDSSSALKNQRRRGASEAYEEWNNRMAKIPHVFEMFH